MLTVLPEAGAQAEAEAQPAPTAAPEIDWAARLPTAGQAGIVQALLDLPAEKRSALHTLQTSVYTSPARYAAEQQHIFRKLPLPVAPSGLLPRGSAMASSEWGVPLLLTRDESGQARVLLNACRHRGAQLVQSREPVASSRMVCPYHAWTYDLRGDLFGLPLPSTFACLEKKSFGLLEFPSVEAGGFLWTVLDRERPADFSTVTGGLAEDLDAMRLGDMHCHARRSHHVECNWKLILDAFQELYHVPMLHANTVKKMFANSITTEDQIGEHTRFVTARRGYEKVNPRGTFDHINELVTFSYLIFPSTILVVSPTFINVLVCHPQSEKETVVEDYMLTPRVPSTEAEKTHYQKSWALLDGGVYEKEDLYAAALQQKGLSSGHLKEVVIGGLEVPIHVFHQHLEGHLR